MHVCVFEIIKNYEITFFNFFPGNQKYSDKDSLEFELKVNCTQNPHSRFGHHRPEDKYINHNGLLACVNF